MVSCCNFVSVGGNELERLFWDKSKVSIFSKPPKLEGIFPESLLLDMLSSFKALRAPYEVGIWPESWLFHKSNKVYMLSLFVEIPCFECFRFTTKPLNSRESCTYWLNKLEVKSIEIASRVMGDGEFGGSLIIPTRL